MDARVAEVVSRIRERNPIAKKWPGPRILTILPTYPCTAACENCCFQCSPKVRGRLSLPEIQRHIETTFQSFPTIKLLVFTGGECFLLGKKLVDAVRFASSLGLDTRCVTNGFWATSLQRASEWAKRLKEAGL